MSRKYFNPTICLLLVILGTNCKLSKSDPTPLYKTITTSKQTYIRNSPTRRAKRLEKLSPGIHLLVLQDPKNRWLRVRTPSNTVGWVESRDLLKRKHFEEWQQLSKQIVNSKPQMHGITIESANLRLYPGRDTIKITRLSDSVPLSIFKMAHTIANTISKKTRSGPVTTRFDTWYLVRTTGGMVGWVYARLINIDIPEELVRLSENRAIVAWRILTISIDSEGREHPWYLSIEREEGSNRDFDRVRVLYWNIKRKRYELAYRIKDLIGILPVEANRVDPNQSGYPSFKIYHKKETHQEEILVDEYQLIGSQIKKLSTSNADTNIKS
ncbi:MAG: SH3 domain-containing protein [Acidobacteriota bacterium]